MLYSASGRKRKRSPFIDQAIKRSTVKKQYKNTNTNPNPHHDPYPDPHSDPHPDHWAPSEGFWDTLPRILLTRRALAEHDRRNRQQDLQLQSSEERASRQRRSARLRQLAYQKQLAHQKQLLTHYTVNGNSEAELRRFARGGGPDLASVRGYPDPTMSICTGQPSRQTGPTTKSKRSSAYDANYQLKLAQAGIFPTEQQDKNNRRVTPANFSEIVARLSMRRPSLSPSRFTEEDFERFRQQTEQAEYESETMKVSMGTIEGDGESILSRTGEPFNNLEPFDGYIAKAIPDSYDGASPLSINHRVLKDLNRHIVPNTDTSRPAVPNFFLEGKSRRGCADVAKRQAAYTGALGARGIMSLQSYPMGCPYFDGNAYTFTNTFHDGQLKLYVSYVVAPAMPGETPSYYMTQLSAFAMTASSKVFREGATWYRNARELAKEYRDLFIYQANKSVSKRSSHSRTTTDTVSSMHTDSQSREYSPDTDTSADEPALGSSFKPGCVMS